MTAPEKIQTYVERLDLSTGDLLGLAREVTQNAALRSIDNLTEQEERNLIDYLRFLAQPVSV